MYIPSPRSQGLTVESGEWYLRDLGILLADDIPRFALPHMRKSVQYQLLTAHLTMAIGA